MNLRITQIIVIKVNNISHFYSKVFIKSGEIPIELAGNIFA